MHGGGLGLAKSGKTSRRKKSDKSDRDQIPHIEPAETFEDKLRKEANPVERFFGLLGPGLITGASDDDPSGIGTYAQAGAALGYAPLWLPWVSFPMMWTIQYMCAKIGMVTGMGLSRVLQKHYSKSVLYSVVAGLTIANTINTTGIRFCEERRER